MTFISALAKWKMRLSRGQSLTYELQKIVMIIIAAKAIDMPNYLIIPLGISAIIGFTLLGLIDEQRFKLWQAEAERSSKHLNPWGSEIMQRIKNIERLTKGRLSPARR